ncbi:MAG: prolyl oligopeptidase family serine peptidase [Cyclobacteriaceae bacterium]
MKIRLYRFFIPFVILCTTEGTLFGQSDPKWDNTTDHHWPKACQKIAIESTIDGKKEPAYFYKSKAKNRSLIVSLHTWSGGYDQKDTLSWQCISRDYNYIHPNFRGVNNHPDACGSQLAIQDIEDAISYAIANGNVDMDEIHVIGASGGGYATLYTYMNTKHKVKTFSAWVPISDIEKWYYESLGRSNKYARHMALATTGKTFTEKDDLFISEPEARKRSPYFMTTPVAQRRNSKLTIYAGVHDGYTGSVPITQSLDFYNKLIGDFEKGNDDYAIPEKDIRELVTSRYFRNSEMKKIGDRIIYYSKNYKDLVEIVIFEGGHEMLSEVALDHVK